MFIHFFFFSYIKKKMSTCVCKFGTLLELASTGKADQFFIDRPSSSFFRRQLVYSGNYAIDWCVKDPFTDRGIVRRATLSQEGDLCIGMMVVGDIGPFDYRFLIDNQCISSNSSDNPTCRQHINDIKGFSVLTDDADADASTLCVPIDAAGCHFIETPLMLQGKQKMSVEITLKDPSKRNTPCVLQSFQVYLPTSIRQEFLAATRTTPLQLYESMEIPSLDGSEDVVVIPLQFNLPVARLLIGITYDSVRLIVNGHTRFEGTRDEVQCISTFLNLPGADIIHFGLRDRDFHFGGAFNMSRMDKVQLEVKKKEGIVAEEKAITAVYHNVLQYKDGIYTLMFMD